jgi:hypothetical protein
MSRTIEQRDLQQDKSKRMNEIMTPGAQLEAVGGMDMDAQELEKFMHEEVEVYVHPSRDKGALAIISPSCNGINQPIIRGVRSVIKRKYVEAMARAHSIKYEQHLSDPSDPSSLVMVPQKLPDYPFDLLTDSERGKEWFRRLQMSI